MKKILFLLTLFSALLIQACKKGQSLSPQTLAGTWKVVSYQDTATHAVYFKSSPEGGITGSFNQDIVITFAQNKDTLSLQGHTVTNEVWGSFLLNNGSGLKSILFAGTKVYEPNWGSWFWTAMRSITSYHLNGNTLTINYNGQATNQVSLVRE